MLTLASAKLRGLLAQVLHPFKCLTCKCLTCLMPRYTCSRASCVSCSVCPLGLRGSCPCWFRAIRDPFIKCTCVSHDSCSVCLLVSFLFLLFYSPCVLCRMCYICQYHPLRSCVAISGIPFFFLFHNVFGEGHLIELKQI